MTIRVLLMRAACMSYWWMGVMWDKVRRKSRWVLLSGGRVTAGTGSGWLIPSSVHLRTAVVQ